MKLTWMTSCGRIAGHLRFQDSKKRLDEGKDLNALVASAVSEFLNVINVQSQILRMTLSWMMRRITLTLKNS